MREINHSNKYLKCMHTIGLGLGGHQQSCEVLSLAPFSDKETESQRDLAI